VHPQVVVCGDEDAKGVRVPLRVWTPAVHFLCLGKVCACVANNTGC
jgi:hypothetical protein